MTNAFDDIPDTPISPPTVAAAAPKGNAFDDITPPIKPEGVKPPVTAWDRVHAAEGGFLGGTAYLATSIPDAAANAFNLNRAAAGLTYGLTHTTQEQSPERTPHGLYHFIDSRGVETYSKNPPPPGSKPVTLTRTDIPSALQVDSNVSPVGNWLTRQMDKSTITTTQIPRPDDRASRYLSTTGSVVPGILSGGGSVGNMAAGVARAVPPALAGQAVYEAKPFEDEWKNQLASILTQTATSAVMPRGQGADVPGNEVRNATIRDAQDAGMVFPPATTNPTPTNRFVEKIAGKQQVQQHATLTNRDAVNEGAREDLQIGGRGGISDAELAQVRAEARPHYAAVRQAGNIQTGSDPNFVQTLTGALQRYTGAGRVLSQSGSGALERDIQDILSHPQSDAGDLVDTIGVLRDRSQTAFRNGEAGIGSAYRQASNAIENQIEQQLPAGSPVLTNFQNARRRLAIAHSIEDARNEGSGDINAQKLASMLHNGVPLEGNLLTAARAASVAPKAFAPITDSRGVNHLNLWGAILGGAALGHEISPEWGLAPAAAAGALTGARLGARAYALGGPGQENAIARQRAPVDQRLAIAAYLSQMNH